MTTLTRIPWLLSGGIVAFCGCASTPSVSVPMPVPTTVAIAKTDSEIVPVEHTEAAPKTLNEFITLAIAKHPRLAQANWAVEAARGRAVQAGLYPNPTVQITGDELGDRTGPGGIWTTPQVNQEIVLGNKLGLSHAVATKEVDQATLAVMVERFRLVTDVRKSFWDVVVLQRRAEVLAELLSISDQSIEAVERLRKAKEANDLDLIPLEVDRERYRAEVAVVKRSLPAAYRKLAAALGMPEMPIDAISAAHISDPLPDYDLEKIQAFVIAEHPLVRSAQVGVERAKLAIARAEAEPIPNVTLSTGYTRQNQNKSNDWLFGASVPMPLWNKNQGGIAAARAQLGEAMNDIGRVQADLSGQVATAYAAYIAAKARSDSYRASILPKVERNLELAKKVFQIGEFDSLKVLQAQRALGEARLELVKAQGETWSAASDLAGLMLDDR